MNAVDIRGLSFGAKAAICWGFFWRGLLVALGSALTGGVVGAVIGGVLGFVLGLMGTPPARIMSLAAVVGGVLGVLVGCWFLYVYVRWLLAARLGGHKLVLVRA